MLKPKFCICRHCGNIVGMVVDAGVPVVCCGEPMHELVANTEDAAKEKHVPVIEQDGNIVTVKVGSVEHPMLDEHYIQFIYLLTKEGGHLGPCHERADHGRLPSCRRRALPLPELWRRDAYRVGTKGRSRDHEPPSACHRPYRP